MRGEQLALPLTSCSTQESKLCALPGQHSGAAPSPCCLVALGELAEAVLESLPWRCRHRRADPLSYLLILDLEL